jgi:hypothetical protein
MSVTSGVTGGRDENTNPVKGVTGVTGVTGQKT